jgi:hypothetical protein
MMFTVANGNISKYALNGHLYLRLEFLKQIICKPMFTVHRSTNQYILYNLNTKILRISDVK